MHLDNHPNFAPMPEGLPADLAEHYQYATRFLLSFRAIDECLPSSYVSDSRERFRVPDEKMLGKLIDSWNSISVLMKWSADRLFPKYFLREVFAARKEYTGEFNPHMLTEFWGEGIHVDRAFKSAFHLVQKLSEELMSRGHNTGDHELLKKLVRSDSNNKIEIVELQPRPELDGQQYDLELAYLLGSLERLEYVPHMELVSEELRREVLSVSKKRLEGKSWQAMGESGSPDSVMTQDEIVKKIEQAGGVKKAILDGLLDCKAVGSENRVSAPFLATKIGMEIDSTYKSHLSWLRDLHLVGGEKSQRGYWIDEQTRDALMLIKKKVGNQVPN